jgi:glycosyltransferase involved in cell wall biosynthesis
MVERADIIHIISGDIWAGAESQVFYTLSNLNKSKDISFVAVLFSDSQLNKKLIEQGIKTIILDEKEYNGLTIILKLSKIIKRFKPKILHVHAYKEHLIGQLAIYKVFRKCTIFRTFHGMHKTPDNLPFIRKIKSKTIHQIEKNILNKKSVNIIAVSKDLEIYLKESFDKAQITQIYNSIQIPSLSGENRKSIREKFNVASDAIWMGTLARLVEVKNLELLIEIGQSLKTKNMHFRISIFGEGPQKKSLQEKINSKGLQDQVVLEGFVQDSFEILDALDIFTLTSFREGLPMSLLEAMAVGTPVICTNVGGIGEVLKNNSGILIDNFSKNDFVDAILRINKDEELRKKLSGKSKNIIDENFNIDHNNKILMNLYSFHLNNSPLLKSNSRLG